MNHRYLFGISFLILIIFIIVVIILTTRTKPKRWTDEERKNAYEKLYTRVSRTCMSSPNTLSKITSCSISWLEDNYSYKEVFNCLSVDIPQCAYFWTQITPHINICLKQNGCDPW